MTHEEIVILKALLVGICMSVIGLVYVYSLIVAFGKEKIKSVGEAYLTKKMYYTHNPDEVSATNNQDERIRALYYIRHPFDVEAKFDPSVLIRIYYYNKHPEDVDAKRDIDSFVRFEYYRRYIEDRDALTDTDPYIRLLYVKRNSGTYNALAKMIDS